LVSYDNTTTEPPSIPVVITGIAMLTNLERLASAGCANWCRRF